MITVRMFFVVLKEEIFFRVFISFYYIRFSARSGKSMGRFRIQFKMGRFRSKITWSIRYSIPKYDRYCDLSTGWTPVSLNFTAEIYGIN